MGGARGVIIRHSIGHQAAVRIVVSLSLLVALISSTAIGIYWFVLNNAIQQRSEELSHFYAARLAQIERDWDIRARDLKVRIEVTRLLESPATAAIHLAAFMTMQGADRSFQYFIIQSADGKKQFEFGKDLSLTTIPLSAGDGIGYYWNPENRQLYRVFQNPIWIGTMEMGRFAVFFQMDNALLYQMSTPGLTLRLLYDHERIASSIGQRDLEGYHDQEEKQSIQSLPWSAQANDPVRLIIDAPLATLFSKTELVTSIGIIPALDGLVLWFTVGLWLMRQTRRIRHLGEAVALYTTDQHNSAALTTTLARAASCRQDEIQEVATSLEAMVLTIAAREQAQAESDRRLHLAESIGRMKSEFLANMSRNCSGVGKV